MTDDGSDAAENRAGIDPSATAIDAEIGIGHVDAATARTFEDEAIRVVKAGEERGVALRILGALAFHHHCPQFGYLQSKLNRVYTDIDFAGYGKQNAPIRELFVSLGYDEDLEINAFHAEGGRLIFNNPTTHIHGDVFMDRLDFCHPIPWKGRLEVDSPTIPLAELLLEKMQIVKINEKDIIDSVMLLREHEMAEDDDDHINAKRVAELCAGEWGLWRTTTMNLDKVRDFLPHFDLTPEDGTVVTKRIEELRQALDAYPKGTKWRLRARVGDRVKWYREID